MRKILIVEDEAISALFLQSALEDMGFVVTGVLDSGEEAVEMAQAHRPDFVLMDINLSGELNGVQAAQQIRRLTGIHSIFISAWSREDLRKSFPIDDDSRLISKPVMEHELRAAIRSLSGRAA